MTMVDDKCDCCGKEKPVGVASLPGIPVSIAWCPKCLAADVIPYEYLVGNTAMIGNMEKAAPWWMELVDRTLAYFDIDRDKFNEDVEEASKRIDEAAIDLRDRPEPEPEEGVSEEDF